MKKTFFAILIALGLVQYSCKKDPKKDESDQLPYSTLIDPNTGWQYVTSIDEETTGSPKVYDFTNVGNDFAVLYSTSFQKDVSNMEQFYKVRFKYNDAKNKGTPLQAYDANKAIPFWQAQFIPNTLLPVFTRPANGGYEMSYFDENNTRQGHLLLDHFTTKILYHYTEDANFTVSGNDNGKLSFWNTRYPATGIMKEYKTIGAAENAIAIPMKFADGSANLFIIEREKNSKNFEVIRLEDGKETALDAGMLEGVGKLQEMNQSLMAFDYKDDVVTFVLADYIPTATSSDVINKIHCYRWNRRIKGITKLWACTTTPDFSKAVLSPTPTGPNSYAENIYLNRKIAPDGTFYTIYTKPKYAEPNVGNEYTAIYTANAGGVRQTGKTEQLFGSGVALSHCRFIDGAYYALAYPLGGSGEIKADDPRHHIELVKFIP